MKEEILNELLLYMNETKDFILQQSPEVIQQMFLYYKINNWIGVAFGSLLSAIALGVFIYSWIKPVYDEPYKDLSLLTFLCRVASTVVLLICFVTTVESVDGLIKLYFAPKFFIIQKILTMK